MRRFLPADPAAALHRITQQHRRRYGRDRLVRHLLAHVEPAEAAEAGAPEWAARQQREDPAEAARPPAADEVYPRLRRDVLAEGVRPQRMSSAGQRRRREPCVGSQHMKFEQCHMCRHLQAAATMHPTRRDRSPTEMKVRPMAISAPSLFLIDCVSGCTLMTSASLFVTDC